MKPIKRYDLGSEIICKAGDCEISAPGIVEVENGAYIKYEDYEAVMESIGAGGVSGRIIRKPIRSVKP